MKRLFIFTILLSTFAATPILADDEEMEDPDAMSATEEDQVQFTGEPEQDPSASVHDLKSEVSSLKIRMDEMLREMAVLRKERGEGGSPSHQHSLEGSASPAVAQTDEGLSPEDEVLKMLDDASVSDSSASAPTPAEDLKKKRKEAQKKAEKEAPTLPKGNALAQYNEAFALYKNAAYPEAERAFQYVVKAYPKDPVAKKSTFWLAECALAQNNSADARKQFLKAYEQDKKGPNASECLFKMGLTFTKEKQPKKACVVWKKLSMDYPNMPKTMKDKVQKAQKTHKCS